ncbi:class I SAM-dependent methyltransferase [Dyadobacter arcticus]|uniref:SAM-dependent methyltransferase n=1 Tax=Dyadobacter arcticus TaxID=1078754 RepID=A0ABX0UTV2_9BACT|nr:class I SAM-dependent methyltransferase [Dyadobacter arcticus]NIJ54366.1 SAM-dependent methyltransferase [Dyadobacter arcticus]
MTAIIEDNWYETFFSGLNCEMWERAAVPDWTENEVDFLLKVFGDKVTSILDIPCGFGRHTISLARRGFNVTGLDISAEFISTLRDQLATENLPVTVIQGDILTTTFSQKFDAAYCLGNSFGYVDDDGMNLFVQNVSAALKTGARLVINSGLVAESILVNFPKTKQFVLGDMVMDISNSYDMRESCMITELTYTKPDRIEKHSFKHYVYTLSEIRRLLRKHGLKTIDVYNSTEMVPYQLGDAQIYLVAEKE